MKEAGQKRAAHCAANFEKWLGIGNWGGTWSRWWKKVGPKAPDSSYARLVWQMPDGGTEVTYEWARTAPNEIVGRIRNSAVSDLAIQAYMPWTMNSPQYAVLYSQAKGSRYLHGRSWIPGTRDGMRWVLACSQVASETAGNASARRIRQTNRSQVAADLFGRVVDEAKS